MVRHFGRDALANYIIIGSKQLGVEIFSVKDGKVTLNIDEKVMKNYGIISMYHI